MHGSEYTTAFNLGSDARIAGLPLKANPHSAVTDKLSRNGWRHGWLDVDRYFGEWAKWPVRTLPTPMGVARV